MVRSCWLILSGVLLSMAGCATPEGGSSAGAGGDGDGLVVTAAHLDWITDVQWTLERMMVQGRPYPLAGDPPTVQFGADGRITGFGSINRFFGLMQIEAKGRVRWPGSLGSTRMAGPPGLMRQEETFMQAIQAVKQWRIAGTRLYGHDAENSTELVFSVPTP
ncbi:MAG: META domain-containing protein [Phycisphaerae bacterium]|nr:META domain-containing protein [Phycisphaerae bacterium]